MKRGSMFRLSAPILFAGFGAPFALGQIPPGPPGQPNFQSSGPAIDDADRGARLAASKCAACHGADGNSTNAQYPKLAGQKAAYLYSQLRAFKDGYRRSEVMSGIAATLSNADIADAASFFSQQSVHPDPVKDPRLKADGERIFLYGARSGRVPACAMCHGSTSQAGMPMMGMMPMMANVPSLNGQHSAYIIDQLNRFASGERQAMMMGGIAAALSDSDKKAIAEFLSNLPR
ncbi:cytochrome C [Burkholderia vietnamiensis]|nr:cytochrome c family protein [Burkholderia vietnamiensis LMG 10929]AVR14835.1 cytochrome c4 [Burkholderia vietnamiensis]KVF14460.1 cytochrome C [Burkholderia vietnamiensis]KVF72731.1 cytochrome C [Burkholderia vietnamiensis]KVF80059.1 cytochrome C [Burkholderia vietnamiensis]